MHCIVQATLSIRIERDDGDAIASLRATFKAKNKRGEENSARGRRTETLNATRTCNARVTAAVAADKTKIRTKRRSTAITGRLRQSAIGVFSVRRPRSGKFREYVRRLKASRKSRLSSIGKKRRIGKHRCRVGWLEQSPLWLGKQPASPVATTRRER